MPVEVSQAAQWLIPVLCVVLGWFLGFISNLFREKWAEGKKKEKNNLYIKSEIDLSLERLRKFFEKAKEKHGDITMSFLKETFMDSGYIGWSNTFFQEQLLPLALTLNKEDMKRLLKFNKTLDIIYNYCSKFSQLGWNPFNRKEVYDFLEIIEQTLQEGNPIKD
jgi:hypothetical protein